METIIVIFVLAIAAIIVCFEAHIREVDADNAEKDIEIKRLKKVESQLFNKWGKQKAESEVLSGTIVRMKKKNESLTELNGLLEKRVEALKQAPLKFETFYVQPIEITREINVDDSFFEHFGAINAEDMIIKRVAEDFATTIMNDYNNYQLKKSISFMGDSTVFQFKMRIYPYNHNINYRKEGLFSPRKF